MFKSYLKGYKALDRDPVLLPQLVRDGVLIVVSGLVVFDVTELNTEQMGWVLMFAGFVGVLVSLWSRNKAWPDAVVQNEFLSAEDGLDLGTDSINKIGIRTESDEEYGDIEILVDDE